MNPNQKPLLTDLTTDEADSLNGGRYCRYVYYWRRVCYWYGCVYQRYFRYVCY
jgi:hypothetical protein